VHSKAAFASELNNAAYYTAYILKQNGLTPKRYTTVLSHHDVSNRLGGTNHTDPDGYWKSNASTYFGTTYTMTDFVSLVNTQYAKLSGSSTSTDDPADNNTDTSTDHTTPTTKKTVTYNHGSNNETATLANNYTNWTVYNHVKGTSGAYKIGWGRLSADHKGAEVYVDSRGVKKGGWSGTWYRIRFSKNTTTKYWVYSKVLNFPKVTYSDASGTMTLNNSQNYAMYNHVLNSSYLSKTTAHTQDFSTGTKVTVNKQGNKASDGSTWYRIVLNNKAYWIKAAGLNTNA
ncbi:N-acetylmuramoyl-L-alanine amidase, partial [Levilactobacillus brevis]|nr:N-acetylmuramoyl-L-alanine amidase [Levilactobacillus brevis]